tara:strand:+ start:1074 stop:1469 length:396 start_codon:yes stop_codon:yes gene_type:complete
MTMLTMIVPATMMTAANHFAMALGRGTADRDTFLAPNWQDASGELYAVASQPVNPLAPDPKAPLLRPEWDTTEIIDMEAARASQEALALHDADDPASVLPQVRPDALLGLQGGDPMTLMASIGLKRAPQSL